MEIQEKRFKLIEKLSRVENEFVLDEIQKILDQGEITNFNFDKEYEEGLTADEFLEEMKKRICNWNWKK